LANLPARVGLTGDDNQQTRHVVGTEAMGSTRFSVIGMLEGTDGVAHGHDVVETVDHHALSA
jgi:hypothetical protein